MNARATRFTHTCAALAALACLHPASAQQAVPLRKDAGYVLPGGAIQIVTSAQLAGLVRALDELYTRQHPGTSFVLRVGDNYTAMAALTFDKTAVAAMGSEYTRIGLGDNLKIAAEPVGIRVAHTTLTPGAGVPTLGVIVNSANPLSSLSLPQLARIFTVGAGAGDLATWGQAGVKGPLAERRIAPIGPLPSDEQDSDDPQAGEFLSTSKFAGANVNHAYVSLPHYSDVVARVNEDPAAIGLTALNLPLGSAKVVALKSADTAAPHAATAAEIGAGRYPLDRFVFLYLRMGKGMPLDEFGKEYIRLALSPEGQSAIAHAAEGYLPLSPAEAAAELTKVDR